MEFTKYKDFGDYHWKDYLNNNNYRSHVRRIMSWITEKKVLDIGCGDGLITSKIGAKGIDNEPEGIKLALEHGVDAELGSVYDLMKYGQFEAVLLADTFEHLERPVEALDEISKITNILYIVVPNQTNVEDFAYTAWTPRKLTEFMQENGWKELYQENIAPVNPIGEHKIYGKYENFTNNRRRG